MWRTTEQEWGEESSMYTGSVLGEFPENLDETVVPLSAARKRPLLSGRLEPGGENHSGVRCGAIGVMIIRW